MNKKRHTVRQRTIKKGGLFFQEGRPWHEKRRAKKLLIEPEVMVLLSGGLDSAACVHFYVDFGRTPLGLFIDYGQLAAGNESRSARAVAAYYSVPLICLTWRGWLPKPIGLIQARNLFLLSAAMMERPDSISVIALGIHSGTNYPDSSESFLARVQSACDVYEQGRVKLAAPFLNWSKADIHAYCLQEDVPVHLTYSCESGGRRPCGECPSCKERQMLYVST